VLSVALGRVDATLLQCTFDRTPPGPTACVIDVPAGASALWLTADTELRRTVESLALEVITPSAPALCGLRARRVAVTGAGAVYVLDGAAYAEADGVWVEGHGTAQFLVSPGRNGRLLVRQGPADGDVTITGDGWTVQKALRRGEEWDVTLPGRSRDDPSVSFRVTASAGARPSDAMPTSRDTRVLGCWVTLR
jgi:hypothetical protein